MIRFGSVFLFSLLAIVGCAQKNNDKENKPGDVVSSLLWKIEGNGLQKPSYLFGTIHMICKDDAVLSANMKKVISECDEVKAPCCPFLFWKPTNQSWPLPHSARVPCPVMGPLLWNR